MFSGYQSTSFNLRYVLFRYQDVKPTDESARKDFQELKEMTSRLQTTSL
jgi:hypothetical protein